MEKCDQIERSLIKKYRKPLWRPFIKAIQEYDLIQNGDKIAVCISGGKDSMLMAKLMQELQRHGPISFELVFLAMNPGYSEQNQQQILDNAALLDIPLTVFKAAIFDVVENVDSSPCYLCARMRRGSLYQKAQEFGCNKIALGHHFDDVIETILMNMFYGGTIETMMPKLRSRNFEGMELIRPLYHVKEADIIAWKDYHQLTFLQCACRFTEMHENQPSGIGGFKRKEMKALIGQLRELSPLIDGNIFQSVQSVNLEKIISYRDRDGRHHFLEKYADGAERTRPDMVE
ncbi:tRNA 2-thiocytidine biosynthesis TtcA family protein [Trichococcus collinsii]|uniref:tRNA(Ile)-lysidine synthase TilS/MesJ n=1 Tax=Trichococcus collinsii TaxID=157076 RepID=A0AB37ZZK2_9LACT|nr:ATP-binding protein [Trichococcus collinsii]CZR06507.1 trna(ile)-lysidine/2-thiocytidine synthase [Trichococcus collinsii]SEA32111.1 tRNA(Ile)-lysidine synthase TilS/MesJ [Trichococcus collinsii]